jgi:ABC-type lipoprotein export system ATPase subunit
VTLGRTSPLSSPVSPLILCDNLVKIYKVADLEVVALQGLDLRVELGEMLGIVGPSGSGKTTLLNILGGLDRPSAGQVTVKGQDLLKLSDTALNRYRRSQVGFVWQQTARNLIPYLTVQENVELPMTVAGVGWREKRTRAQELLEAVGLSERRHHRLAELSGGEQQRAAIAVALANRPPLVAIRDGKTATEMVRGEDAEERGEVLYSEYVLLDSAGRLQIPGEYREQYGIGERVRLEPADEGLLIRPVGERRTVAAPLLAGLEEEPPAPRRRGVRGLWARRRKG